MHRVGITYFFNKRIIIPKFLQIIILIGLKSHMQVDTLAMGLTTEYITDVLAELLK